MHVRNGFLYYVANMGFIMKIIIQNAEEIFSINKVYRCGWCVEYSQHSINNIGYWMKLIAKSKKIDLLTDLIFPSVS